MQDERTLRNCMKVEGKKTKNEQDKDNVSTPR